MYYLPSHEELALSWHSIWSSQQFFAKLGISQPLVSILNQILRIYWICECNKAVLIHCCLKTTPKSPNDCLLLMNFSNSRCDFNDEHITIHESICLSRGSKFFSSSRKHNACTMNYYLKTASDSIGCCCNFVPQQRVSILATVIFFMFAALLHGADANGETIYTIGMLFLGPLITV